MALILNDDHQQSGYYLIFTSNAKAPSGIIRFALISYNFWQANTKEEED